MTQADGQLLLSLSIFSERTNDEDWAYGFGRMKLGTVSVPLHIDIPAGVTSVRLIAAHPWKAGNGIRMQGFFLSAGPARISRDNYYGLDLGQR